MVSFKKPQNYNPKWIAWGKLKYRLFSIYRYIRIHKLVTSFLGPQYVRSRNLIEIDITYLCNLNCYNCNRSCRQAPSNISMSRKQIKHFVDESIKVSKDWERIRILGGEPALNPEFHKIIEELLRFKKHFPQTIVEVVTNGYGKKVNARLAKLPVDIELENSNKNSVVQPHFGTFNIAPIDLQKYRTVDFCNACEISKDCGMGLTPFGYYHCAIAGGIDRIIGLNLGRKVLPEECDDMLDQAQQLCALCGRFLAGHFIPRNLRKPLWDEVCSPTWEFLYNEWNENPPEMKRYGVG